MKNLKYSQILSANSKMGQTLKGEPYDIYILSNITIHQIKEILEYSVRSGAINASVTIGDYDNIIQDSIKYGATKAVIIFWELCNIVDGFQFKSELLSENEFETLLEKIKLEIALVLKNLQNCSLVLFNKFTTLHFQNQIVQDTVQGRLALELNNFLENNREKNVTLVDLEKIVAFTGVEKSLELRHYYTSKALYSIEFLKSYSEFVRPFFMAANGKSKKVLVFDCDNTLWKGILGEDGENIEMSLKTKDGAIFNEVQHIALALQKTGVLLCLCSKNNPGDVEAVLESNRDMVLKSENIAVIRSNWSDKVSNLKEIAAELNVGLDSFVFIDDSSFEVNMIREELPHVTVLQVPEKLFEYPKMVRENIGLFYNPSITEEDREKTAMYRAQSKREEVKKKFTDIEGYFRSLEMSLLLFEDDISLVPRMAQMSQKTNQFNLTTKRYTESDIQGFVADNHFRVFAFGLSDKFGDSGLTGLCIVCFENNNKEAYIDSFLMSCRIIGRNVEYAFMDFLITYLMNSGIEKVRAKFIKSKKNVLVRDFYKECSFTEKIVNEGESDYFLNTSEYKPKKIDYIEVKYGKQVRAQG